MQKDSDFDQMPDEFEVHENLDPLFGDADQDPDGDGVTNYEEYLARTGPFDPLNVRVEDYMLPIINYLLNSDSPLPEAEQP